MTRLAVVGAGYVGLVNAACLAEIGHEVAVVEANPARLASLRRGEVGMMEPGLDELVRANLQRGRLSATADYRPAVDGAEYAMIAVNTPVGGDGHHDLTNLWAAADSLAASVDRDATVVILSTVPPGTTDRLGERLREAGRSDLHVAVLPEFFQEGRAVHDAWNPARVIVGCHDRDRGQRIADLWRREDVPVVLTDPPTAELTKLAANSFLATKISFMNEVADHASRVGADVTQVAYAMGLDPRIGASYLSAGIGFGGSCLPKDLAGLARQIESLGGMPRVMDAVLQVNLERSAVVLSILRSRLVRPGSRVAVLGIAFKPGTSDRRDSTSITLARALSDAGYEVCAADPSVDATTIDEVAAEIGHGVTVLGAADATAGAHALVLATEWPEFVALDWHQVSEVMAGTLVVDGRNALDATAVRAAGLDYIGVGRS